MSAKPPKFIATQKPAEPLTWETFARVQPITRCPEVVDNAMLRIKYRVATSVLIRLHDSGCTIRVDDGKLLVRPGERISDDDKRLIGMVREEMIRLIDEGCLERFESVASE